MTVPFLLCVTVVGCGGRGDPYQDDGRAGSSVVAVGGRDGLGVGGERAGGGAGGSVSSGGTSTLVRGRSRV
jgi:hypothetical protein